MESKLSTHYYDYLDFLSEIIAGAPTTSSDTGSYNVDEIELLRALLMNPPEEFVRDGFLEELKSVARDVQMAFRAWFGSSLLGERVKSALKPLRMWSKDKSARKIIRSMFSASRHIDLLSEVIAKAPTESSHSGLENVEYLQLLRAILMNPPEEIVEYGFLKELQSVAGDVRRIFSLYDSSKYSRIFKISSREINSALKPMRMWSAFYSLLPDKKSITETDTAYDEGLRGLPKEFAIIKDHRKMFFKEFVSWYKKNQSSNSSYSSSYDDRDHFIRNLRFELDGLKPSENDLPCTGELGFIEHVVENLKELVKAKADSLGPVKACILQLQEILLELLQLISSRPTEEEEYVLSQITVFATRSYEVEIAIDSFLVGCVTGPLSIIWLCDIMIKFKTDMQRFKQGLGDQQLLVSNIKEQGWNTFKVYPIFVNHTNNISEKLREIIRDPKIRHGFEIYSWCLVSSYREREKEVFLELLGNASYRRQDDLREFVKKAYTSDMNVRDLKRLVHHILVKEDYLIILEDVLDIAAMNDIVRTLPTTSSVRRRAILFTTPSAQLAALYRDGLPAFSYGEKSADDSSTSQTNEPTTDGDVVGFQEETKRMLDQLTGEAKELNIISIVGMGGQGKTTLAKKLYNHPLIVNHFNVRAWCPISQVYKKRELLMELLGQVGNFFDSILDKNDAELAHMLWKSLTKRRFLVVLDDIWSVMAWNALQKCFPDDKNGSRIIFTTRLQGLVSQAKSSSISQSVGPLSIGESLELLKKKVSHPPELLGIARQIVEHCKGLPISIVLIAGLLEKIEKREDQWKKIVENLLGDGKEFGQAIIELSYKHLSNSLKSCLLYVGAFLEDKEIRVSKLILLWVAEGFIKQDGLKSLEDTAEAWLMDLISRSLVMVAQKRSNNGVKSCLVHDLVRDFCLAKARKEKFFDFIPGYDKHFSSSTNDMDYGIGPNYSCSSKSIRYSACRLSIHSKRNHFVMLKPFGQFVRSLLFFAVDDMCPNYPYDISFISRNFKLLRVLDLEDINASNSFKAIEVLILLRYLAIRWFDFIPSSIANLWNLETFLVKGLRAKIVKVSNSIWDMKNLRHFHINRVSFDLDPQKLEKSSVPGNLQSFSTPSLSYEDDMLQIMRKIMPGIQKLKCIFLDSWDDTEKRHKFPNLEFLIKLVSLKVLYNGLRKYPCKFSLPLNLKKLSLSKFHMSRNEILQLATLTKLEVLKLQKIVFEGEKWEMEDDVVFQKLKFLKLESLSIVEWVVSNENFPYLNHLVLQTCDRLEEIPKSVGDIDTLEMIEVIWCNQFVATSASLIKEEQREYKEINVHILPEVWDSESSSSNDE